MTHSSPQSAPLRRDHGGGLDAAAARFGGAVSDWIDLSTGINPCPYPIAGLAPRDWAALPDQAAQTALLRAARAFWQVPDAAAILAAPGASALIARLPGLASPGCVAIHQPTYNEHAASFLHAGWTLADGSSPNARVLVHPNNPDGRMWTPADLDAPLCVIDESFCDVTPASSLVAETARPGRIVLKSFGKFWGLAGLRLGFAIGDPALLAQLAEDLGPWPVSGPALRIGARALQDTAWAGATRARLKRDAARLDRLMTGRGATVVGGTDLFRLYDVGDATRMQKHLAQARIWSRIFPYASHLIRLGLPSAGDWSRLEAAL